jgi:hypothetical protein
MHEEGMIGTGADDANLDAVFGVPSSESIKDVNMVSSVQVIDGTFSVDLEGVLV